jgi:pyruvate/2-oxoglutarate dehydrogenase complex dihydrolipoamide acyltransferase (E2) component
MTQILRIPKVAVSMREGTLVAWLVADGSTVQEGQPIFTLELEKSTMDVEAPAAGVIRQTGQAGTTYKVGEIIGEIGAPAAPEADVLRRTPLVRLVQVVSDLDAAMQAWRNSIGAGPFFLFPHLAFTSFEQRGSPAPKPDVSIAVGSAGDFLIELVQQHDTSDCGWREAGIGSTMLAVTAEDFDATVAAHASAASPCISMATYPFGARLALVDARASAGQWLVILENHFVLDQLSEKIKAAGRGWDGKTLTAELK